MDRLTHSKGAWERVEYWVSKMGSVVKVVEGWEGRVITDRGVGRIGEVFESAEVAMRMVERVWKREEERRNGKCKT